MVGYLDIETSFQGELTVVGLLRADRGVVQVVGEGITADVVAESLRGLDTICTFHGEGFDLPVIRRDLGIDLIAECRSVDLSLECRRLGIRGGLKAIEASMGIARRSTGLTGYDAMVLWDRWLEGDRASLRTLLEYNREDVINLVLLERRLAGDLCELAHLPTTVVGV